MTATLAAAPMEAPNAVPRNGIDSLLAGLITSGLGIAGATLGIAGVFGSGARRCISDGSFRCPGCRWTSIRSVGSSWR